MWKHFKAGSILTSRPSYRAHLNFMVCRSTCNCSFNRKANSPVVILFAVYQAVSRVAAELRVQILWTSTAAKAVNVPSLIGGQEVVAVERTRRINTEQSDAFDTYRSRICVPQPEHFSGACCSWFKSFNILQLSSDFADLIHCKLHKLLHFYSASESPGTNKRINSHENRWER